MVYHPKRKPEHELPVRIVTIIGKSLWSLLSWPFRGLRAKPLDQIYYREHWDLVVQLVAHQNTIEHWKQAVIEGDKLVDQAMRELLFPGNTFGERLKGAEHRFDRDIYQHLWQAHKLRNQIAHEIKLEFSKQDAESALDGFASGLHSLGAI